MVRDVRGAAQVRCPDALLTMRELGRVVRMAACSWFETARRTAQVRRRECASSPRGIELAEGAVAIAEEIEPTWRPDFGLASRQRLRCAR
jgi:hypothetical protein